MTGIRESVTAKFVELLPQLGKELSSRQFRKAVMDYTVAEFGVTVSSAASHYNYALKLKRLENPELVEGLGRG
jgi:hypothetical protein